MPLTAPGSPNRDQQVRVDLAGQQQQGAEPELQGAEDDPAEGPAASQPLLGGEPAQDPQHACEHREMPSSPTNTLGSTTRRAGRGSSTSAAPTTAAVAAAKPSRNPGRGRMARANRSVMSPPVIQNRARKVIRRPVLRLPTVMANARLGRPPPQRRQPPVPRDRRERCPCS